MKSTLRIIIMIGLAVLLTACPKTKQDRDLTDTLTQYETIIRWAQWDAAADFVAPEYQEDHPITRLELDRLRLFRVTQYKLRSVTPMNDSDSDGLVQVVEIRLFNKSQSRELTIIDEQIWKYDEEYKRWFLYSGLPDPTRRY